MENQNQRIWIIVALSTLLFLTIIFIGIGYAFFSANNPEGSTAQIISENGRMLITYDDGTDNIVPVTDIQPSDKILVNKTFTLTGINTTVGTSASDGLTMPYKVGVQYTSGFSAGMLHYYIKSTSKSTGVTEEYTGETDQTVQGNDAYTGYSHGTFKTGSKYTEMVTGEFPASLNNQTITFNLIIQFPDNNENQDSEKGKTFNGKIMINYEYDPFKDDSWSEIADNVKNKKGNLYKIGSEKEIEIGGKNYTIRVANNTTPDECNGEDFSETACGFVVEFVDIVETRVMNSTSTSVGGWPASSLRTYANGDFFNKLPSDLQKVVIDTKIISGHGSASGETNFTSTDKIYLLSGREVYVDGTSKQISLRDTAYNNTRQLDYYKDKGVTTSSYAATRKKPINLNSYTYWWLRTPDSTYNYIYLLVTGSGYWDYRSVSGANGFAPAFRIG